MPSVASHVSQTLMSDDPRDPAPLQSEPDEARAWKELETAFLPHSLDAEAALRRVGAVAKAAALLEQQLSKSLDMNAPLSELARAAASNGWIVRPLHLRAAISTRNELIHGSDGSDPPSVAEALVAVERFKQAYLQVLALSRRKNADAKRNGAPADAPVLASGPPARGNPRVLQRPPEALRITGPINTWRDLVAEGSRRRANGEIGTSIHLEVQDVRGDPDWHLKIEERIRRSDEAALKRLADDS